MNTTQARNLHGILFSVCGVCAQYIPVVKLALIKMVVVVVAAAVCIPHACNVDRRLARLSFKR